MPNIRSSADLRNNYNDISSYCHAYNEPVFITKNGKGDLPTLTPETRAPLPMLWLTCATAGSADEIQNSRYPSRRA